MIALLWWGGRRGQRYGACQNSVGSGSGPTRRARRRWPAWKRGGPDGALSFRYYTCRFPARKAALPRAGTLCVREGERAAKAHVLTSEGGGGVAWEKGLGKEVSFRGEEVSAGVGVRVELERAFNRGQPRGHFGDSRPTARSKCDAERGARSRRSERTALPLAFTSAFLPARLSTSPPCLAVPAPRPTPAPLRSDTACTLEAVPAPLARPDPCKSGRSREQPPPPTRSAKVLSRALPGLQPAVSDLLPTPS